MLDVSNIWIKVNYFLITNKFYFKKWWVLLMIAADIFILIFAFTNLILYIFSIPRENLLMQAMASQQIDYPAIRTRTHPVSLTIVSSTAIPLAESRYDLVTEVKNTNVNWAVNSITYHYEIGETSTEARDDFILPDGTKYLAQLGVQSQSSGTAPEIKLIIENIDWVRVNDDSLPPITFDISNIEYTNTSTGDISSQRVTAQITNTGLNGFWQTRFAVVLYNGNKIVGINFVYLSPFKAGEKKMFVSQWNQDIPNVTETSITPDVNILQSDNII
ncbi:MAG: hypothetical protein WCV50_01470 [Patescibacteria group bacterium]|jgi:hypothetical protein